jgi:capsid protein
MNFCQPVYEAWIEEAISIGRISAPGFFADPAIRRAWCASTWIGDGPGSIDPEKEVKAAKMRIELRTSTIAAESLLHDGVDWRIKHRQRVIENNARIAGGFAGDQSAAATESAPDDTNEDNSP